MDEALTMLETSLSFLAFPPPRSSDPLFFSCLNALGLLKNLRILLEVSQMSRVVSDLLTSSPFEVRVYTQYWFQRNSNMVWSSSLLKIE